MILDGCFLQFLFRVAQNTFSGLTFFGRAAMRGTVPMSKYAIWYIVSVLWCTSWMILGVSSSFCSVLLKTHSVVSRF